MKKKTNITTVIRKIVREEVALAIGEVITELKQPTQQISQPKPPQKIVEKKSFTSNSVLNDVLNETAQSEEWKTMGGGTFDSSKMNDMMSGQYGDMMNNNPNAPVAVDGQTPDFLTKDYRKVMKAIDKKNGKK
jgi:hypothetical protein|tara:strand:- start:480 stop:878 length:399 start_codon:yes stop_codon:yes gene_type:complete